MSLHPEFRKKWLDARRVKLEVSEFTLVDDGLLWAANSVGEVVAISVLEPGDLNPDWIQRMEERRKREESKNLTFGLFLPAHCRERAKTLLPPDIKCEFTSFLKVRLQGSTFSIRSKLRVVCVDDSPVILKLLNHSLAELAFVETVDQITNPAEAVDRIVKTQPDVVTMDIQMPGMTGVEVVQKLLPKMAVPVIMISSLSLDDGSLVFQALNAGAFDYLQKPKMEERKAFTEHLKEKLLMAAGSRIESERKSPGLLAPVPSVSVGRDSLWCLGASTGGTQALTEIFRRLPADIPPTLIVQHIPPVFSKAFATSLNDVCKCKVKEAEDGDEVKWGTVYIAPGGMQMALVQKASKLSISIRDEAPVNRFKPSVDYLFKTVCGIKGYNIVAGVLTGMGRDGAQGLLDLRRTGARTFTQDQSSSAVYGMPRVAFEIGGSEKVVPLGEIAETLFKFSIPVNRAA
ncbi:MAG: chemotaxis-specific protein-glutamate methyltransferase CheB [Bdellovibrionales bacterium]